MLKSHPTAGLPYQSTAQISQPYASQATGAPYAYSTSTTTKHTHATSPALIGTYSHLNRNIVHQTQPPPQTTCGWETSTDTRPCGMNQETHSFSPVQPYGKLNVSSISQRHGTCTWHLDQVSTPSNPQARKTTLAQTMYG